VPDKFTPTASLVCNGSRKAIIQISNQAVVIQFGSTDELGGGLGNIKWEEPETYLPMILAVGREFDAVRVRNLIPGTGELKGKERTQVVITPLQR
jgi:hypothetical protein